MMEEKIQGRQSNQQHSMRSSGVLFLLSVMGGIVLFVQGGLWERLLWTPNLTAAGELAAVCGILFIFWQAAEMRQLGAAGRCIFLGLIVLVETYLHSLILPFVLSGLYFAGLGLLIWGLWYLFGDAKSAKAEVVAGQPARLQNKTCGKREGLQEDVRSMLWAKALYCALPFLLIQLNRMNIAVDYDSLRYGLRSQYVLAGGSFFDALGQVNTVYTYPKGLEVLTLPLSNFHSFSLMTCFQFWTLLLCLFVAAAIVRDLSASEERAAQSFLALSTVCSLTNMSVTAKTDLITLLFQLLMIRCFLKRDVISATAAAVLTLSFKPTAMVFSSIAWASMLCMYLLGEGGIGRRKVRDLSVGPSQLQELPGKAPVGKGKWRAVILLVLAILFTGLMWLRTLLITGMPATSVFTSIWELLGFQAKWPYDFSPIPSEGIDLGLMAGLAKLGKRLLLFLFCPVGEDMEHVLMAWGGLLIPVLFGVSLHHAAVFFRNQRFPEISVEDLPEDVGRTEKKARRRDDGNIPLQQLQTDARCVEKEIKEIRRRQGQVFVLYGAVTLLSLLSLYLLWQVDGNYYMLWYALTVITALGTGSDAVRALTYVEEQRKLRVANREPICVEEQRKLRVTRRAPIYVEEQRKLRVANREPIYVEEQRKLRVTRRAPICVEKQSRLRVGGWVLLLLSLPITLLTGWAGGVGFTPIRLENPGYYDNVTRIRDYEAANGSLEIWEQLSAEGKNRVIAFSDAPECYYFMCNVQSYTDIEGSGGNVRLVKTLNDFKTFLTWAETDYIYFETEYLSRPENRRGEELIHDLIEDGTLTDLYVELPEGISLEAGPDLTEAAAAAAVSGGEQGETPEEGTAASEELSETQGKLCVYGRIDRERVQEPWQEPLDEAAAQQAALMLEQYMALGIRE